MSWREDGSAGAVEDEGRCVFPCPVANVAAGSGVVVDCYVCSVESGVQSWARCGEAPLGQARGC